jgi:hypothetical protein
LTDLPLSDDLKALLGDHSIQQWLLDHCGGGVAPAWGEAGEMVLRFDRDDEAEQFQSMFADRL